MNPPPEDTSRPDSPRESDRTLDADTRRTAVGPPGGPPEAGPDGPGTVAQLAPEVPTPRAGGGSSGGAGTGTGTGPRGVFGRIEPGQTLYAKYLVLRRLGGGAMGDVWLVRHVTLKSEHALKLIIPNIASNGVALMRFQREFEVMASLRHEHAVSIYDACIDEDGGYIDMEFVEGRTLFDVLREAKDRPGRDYSAPLMPLEWVDRVLDQLCDVLQVAHEKGVVHRDLKPANLMLLGGRKPGREYLKVLDFGIAKIRDDPDNVVNQGEAELKTVGFLGTPSYGSPEQALGRDDVDGRADVYSVAVLLYEMATGRLPFRGNHWQIMHQHASAPPPGFAEAAPGLRPMPEVERVILRALAKDRDDRPQTARELHDEFHAAALATPPAPDGPPLPRPPASGDDPAGSGAYPAATEYDGLATYRPSGEQPATLAAIAPPEPRRARTPRRGQATEPGPAARGKGPARARIVAGAVVAALLLLVPVAVVATRRPAPGPVSPGASPSRAKTWEGHVPDGFRAEKGYVDEVLGPTRLRRASDEVTFVRFAPGVYLPEGYVAEDPKDLVDGWPRVIFRADDPDRARFLRIMGGNEWTMGAWDVDPSPGRTDTPAHAAVVSGHYVGETEVTNGQFREFLLQQNQPAPDAWDQSFAALKAVAKGQAARHPAVNVTRQKAHEFARFVRGLLPTEAQWEFDARSRGDERRYVWGNKRPTGDLARVDLQDGGKSAPVASFAEDRTREGAFDFNGNVKEWCRDGWHAYRQLDRVESDPLTAPGDSPTAECIVRGPAFDDIPDECYLTRRQRRPGGEADENIGFRIVIECPDARKPRP